jgi:phosphogluconate dehydratase
MSSLLHPRLRVVTERVAARSAASRAAYLGRMEAAGAAGPQRAVAGCANLAHGVAACTPEEKSDLKASPKPNIAIVSAYNDMLSAHQPLERFPALIKQAVRRAGGVAQFAGGVPAMCDGVTQGRAGMELSLFSREIIAMSTALALSHDLFDGFLCLGVCDKIVPGLVIGASSFGHLACLFVPAGPMVSGLSNPERNKARERFAAGQISRAELLEAESAAYHAPGTCTFYGTANSNQMLMEIMGLHLPGASFVNPNTPLRDALTEAAAERVVRLSALGDSPTRLCDILDERAFVNGIVGLLATGGSTNHTLHLVTMAASSGIRLDWDDFAELSEIVPLLTRIYPNGSADVNQFHAAGGMPVLIGALLDAGLLHEEVATVAGPGLQRYRQAPMLEAGELVWRAAPAASLDLSVLRSTASPFAPNGGLRILDGNLGRAVIKISAVAPEHHLVEAEARVFPSQEALQAAFKAGALHRDVICVVRFQGPKANGMPELHNLMPPLGVLQDLGFKVALVTDGRLSGASGKVPAAIHVTPEALGGGSLTLIQDGDRIRLDAAAGTLELLVHPDTLAARRPAPFDPKPNETGTGRELFALFRRAVGGAEDGASVLGL